MIDGEHQESFEILPGRVDVGLILLCDHASNAIPSEYGTLGMRERDLQRHIAYDIGAAAVTRGIAANLMAPALLTKFSRLLIDPNRGEDDPTLIMRLSDGAVVEGNRHLDEAERLRRMERFHRPYHHAVDGVIDRCIAAGHPPMLLPIHSFTEAWKGRPRPWHVGVLWDKDDRLPRPLLKALRADEQLVVGENEPYTGELKGDCMWQHGTSRGLVHALIEIRQDLIADDVGQKYWADKLSGIMKEILASWPEV